jgi:hypothetical protein
VPGPVRCGGCLWRWRWRWVFCAVDDKLIDDDAEADGLFRHGCLAAVLCVLPACLLCVLCVLPACLLCVLCVLCVLPACLLCVLCVLPASVSGERAAA